MAEYTCTDKQEVVATVKQSDFTEIRVTKLSDENTEKLNLLILDSGTAQRKTLQCNRVKVLELRIPI